MSWAEIKKAVNSNLDVPLNDLILDNTNQCIITEHDLIRDYVNTTYWSINNTALNTLTEQVLVSIDVPTPIEIEGIFFNTDASDSRCFSQLVVHVDSNKKVDYVLEDVGKIYVDGEVILTGNVHLNATTQDFTNKTLYTTTVTKIGTQLSLMPRRALDVTIGGQYGTQYIFYQKVGFINKNSKICKGMEGELFNQNSFTSCISPEVPEIGLATSSGGYNNVTPYFRGYRIITLNDEPIKCTSNFKITVQRNYLYGTGANDGFSFGDTPDIVIPYRPLT